MKHDHVETVKEVLAAGADVNAKDTDGETALIKASASSGGGDHEETVKRLLAAGAEVNARRNDGQTALHAAAYHGHEKIVELLIDNGADVTATDSDGVTPLDKASEKGHKKIVEILLAKGPDVRATPKYGWRALGKAAGQGYTEIVELLIAAGVDVKVADCARIALHEAVWNGHTTIVELLIVSGADLKLADGRTAPSLFKAAERGHTKIVELLIAKGANVDATESRNHLTPLHTASAQGFMEIVKILLAAGADVNAAAESYYERRNGQTPLDMASERGHERIVELLIAKGAALMMECPPFRGQVVCSDNECSCASTTMPPAQGYLWIRPEVAATRRNCLTLESMVKIPGFSPNRINELRARYLPLAVCKEAAMRRGLDLGVAASDYASWVKTSKVPCRATPMVAKDEQNGPRSTDPFKLTCRKCGQVYGVGADAICITSEEASGLFSAALGAMPSSIMIGLAESGTGASLIEEAHQALLRLGPARGWMCSKCGQHNPWAAS